MSNANRIGRAMRHIETCRELDQAIQRMREKIDKLENQKLHHHQSAYNLFEKAGIRWWASIRKNNKHGKEF